MMSLTNIPEDINVEVLLSYLGEDACKVTYRGVHKRNAYQDIVDVESKNGVSHFGIGRHSLYNSLPEYIFHPVERFGSLTKREDQKKFTEEYEKQEEERVKAYRFFAPLDILLLKLRLDIRQKMNEYTESNKVLTDILSDRLSESQKNNRFIKKVIPFLPSCKNIRGNKALLTLMLRKVFIEEGISLVVSHKEKTYIDPCPRYEDKVDDSLDSCFLGNAYDQRVTTYNMHYWSDEECDEDFLKFVAEVEELRLFIQDYFLSIEEEIHFDVSTDGRSLRLSDELQYNYLNYNTNI